MARTFNGSTNSVDLPSGVSLALNSAVTVVFWNHTAGGTQGAAFTVGNALDPSRCMTHAPFVDNTIYWDYGNSALGGRVSTSYSSYLNKWTHVGLVSTGNSGTFQGIYLDGVLAASQASSDGPNATVSTGFIGRFDVFFHTGRIAEFAVWNVVLTANEIKSISKGAQPPLVHPPNIVGYWPLWGVAAPEPDLSGNGRNGTLSATAPVRGNHCPVGPYAPYIPGAA